VHLSVQWSESMPTISEIANYAGVSKSTVSLALNRKQGVSEKMRTRVLQAAEELAAKQPPEIQQVKATSPNGGNRDFKTILALHSSILSSTQHFSGILQGVQQGLEPYNAQLNLAINEPELPDEHIASLYFSQPALHPDGVIVFGSDHYEYIGEKTRQLGIPCVFLGVPLPNTRFNFVASDEEAAAYKATRHLLDLGHRQIAFIGGDAEVPATIQRVAGYRRALRDATLDADKAPVFVEPHADGARAAVEHFVNQNQSITAILFGNNHASRVGLPVIRDASFNIPDDLSVIVFDDTDFQQNYAPPITTITYPLIRQGIWAVQVLMNLSQEPMMTVSQIYFDAVLTKRDSCAPAPSFVSVGITD
jgi:LacI family transcriptional regulator